MVLYAYTPSGGIMTMNERLRAAVVAAEQLPDETQIALATLIEEALSWGRVFKDPRHDVAMQRMLEEVDRQIDAGEFQDMPGKHK